MTNVLEEFRHLKDPKTGLLLIARTTMIANTSNMPVAFKLLQEDNDLQEIVQLVGLDALPPAERITLEAARLMKEDYLQQNAFHDIDAYCSPEKQVLMLRNLFDSYDKMRELHDGGVELEQIDRCRS